jgi:hypothetical protein
MKGIRFKTNDLAPGGEPRYIVIEEAGIIPAEKQYVQEPVIITAREVRVRAANDHSFPTLRAMAEAGWASYGHCGCVYIHKAPDPDCSCRGSGTMFLRADRRERPTCRRCERNSRDRLEQDWVGGLALLQTDRHGTRWWYVCPCQPSPFDEPQGDSVIVPALMFYAELRAKRK